MMGSGIFITGTDTGVGKTVFACGLAAWLRDAGYRVGVMKPAETGCETGAGTVVPQDAVALKEASGCQVPLETLCPYQLREPLAPSVAGEREGVHIDIEQLISLYGEISAGHDVTIVEGAGGLLVPIRPSYTYADLAFVLKIPILVIAANRLGMINHLLLTLEHAACRGLKVLGYVLNDMEPERSLAGDTNREVLASLTGVPCLGELPYLEDPGARKMPSAEFMEERFNLQILRPVFQWQRAKVYSA